MALQEKEAQAKFNYCIFAVEYSRLNPLNDSTTRLLRTSVLMLHFVDFHLYVRWKSVAFVSSMEALRRGGAAQSYHNLCPPSVTCATVTLWRIVEGASFVPSQSPPRVSKTLMKVIFPSFVIYERDHAFQCLPNLWIVCIHLITEEDYINILTKLDEWKQKWFMVMISQAVIWSYSCIYLDDWRISEIPY